MTLEWQKPEGWVMLSECGRYSVSLAVMQSGNRYGAWRRGNPSQMLGAFDRARDAKAACQEHADREDSK